MISSHFITINLFLTAVAGNILLSTTPMCKDFLCYNFDITSKDFRICQHIGCYNDNPRPGSPLYQPLPSQLPPIQPPLPPIHAPLPPIHAPLPPIHAPLPPIQPPLPPIQPPLPPIHAPLPPINAPLPPIHAPLPPIQPPLPAIQPPLPPIHAPLPPIQPPLPPIHAPILPPVQPPLPPIQPPLPPTQPPLPPIYAPLPPIHPPLPPVQPPIQPPLPPIHAPLPSILPPLPPIHAPILPPVQPPLPPIQPPLPPIHTPLPPLPPVQPPLPPIQPPLPPIHAPLPPLPPVQPQAYYPTVQPVVSPWTPPVTNPDIFPHHFPGPYYHPPLPPTLPLHKPPIYPPYVSQPHIPLPPIQPPVSRPTIPAAFPNIFPQYYNPAALNNYLPLHRVPPAPINTPVPIKKEKPSNLTMANIYNNDYHWLLKSLVWPGWEVLLPKLSSNFTDLKDSLAIAINKYGKDWPSKLQVMIKKHSKMETMLLKMKSELDSCKCIMALNKWFGINQLPDNFGSYFYEWLKTLAKKDNDTPANYWNKKPENNYIHAIPYTYYPYYPGYQNYNPYVPSSYVGWFSPPNNPLQYYNPIYNNNQEQWSPLNSYIPRSNPSVVASTSQTNNIPRPMIQKKSNTTNVNSPNVTVIFDLREFNVSKCKSTVTMPKPAVIEQLLKKAAAKDNCFKFESIIVYKGDSNRIYLTKINDISVTNTNKWVISKNNGATNLSLDVLVQNGDTIIINNTNI